MPPVRLKLRDGAYNHLTRSAGGDVGRFLEGRLRAIEVQAKQNCPVDEGELRASSVVKVDNGPHGPVGTLTFTAHHAVFVHEGTRPHWPPFQAVAKWAQRHGFPGPYLVAKAIAMKGTKGVPFLWNALNDVVARARRRRS